MLAMGSFSDLFGSYFSSLYSKMKKTASYLLWGFPLGVTRKFEQIDVRTLAQEARKERGGGWQIHNLEKIISKYNVEKTSEGLLADCVRTLGLPFVALITPHGYNALNAFVNGKPANETLLQYTIAAFCGYAAGTILSVVWKRSYEKWIKEEFKKGFVKSLSGYDGFIQYEQQYHASENSAELNSAEPAEGVSIAELEQEARDDNPIGASCVPLKKKLVFDWEGFERGFEEWYRKHHPS